MIRKDYAVELCSELTPVTPPPVGSSVLSGMSSPCWGRGLLGVRSCVVCVCVCEEGGDMCVCVCVCEERGDMCVCVYVRRGDMGVGVRASSG